MKSLCFVHQSKAQLPELQAYAEYFRHKYQVVINTPDANLQGYDIVWFFMGYFHYKPQPHQFIVHEYASLSTPPFARFKDQLKQMLNIRPHLRVFQNPRQSDLLQFNDDVPVRYRDMGLSGHFTTQLYTDKKCDLIYVGSMNKSRQLERAIDTVLKLRPHASMWLVGQPVAYLQRRYQHHANIRFIGAVPNSQIPQLLNQARFGLNYVPDVYPYNFQTSTKMLEYVACGLPVIGNRTAWVNSFLTNHKLQYHDINQLKIWPTPGAVTVASEVLQSWSWQQRIADAGFETILP
ncbi:MULTISPECIES: glycosyltransferase [Rheinheimera]|uniref:Spore protein YkvP/CgeB glycosyl transferase-like domain-containing protein n=1 Tax=Rheinheimera aquimaris TaxID=412437 RepID=A0ABN1DAH8_9GAMM|nr:MULTISPECIES: glycosyltransferase [Rheinheimera]MCB5212562.1 glycosyltransferase [Rheinheimera aquimaris]MCD1599840.1 glycosyltransferase [Rheinheimera aquimaris]